MKRLRVSRFRRVLQRCQRGGPLEIGLAPDPAVPAEFRCVACKRRLLAMPRRKKDGRPLWIGRHRIRHRCKAAS